MVPCKYSVVLLFSAVISEHFSKNCMIISVVAAKIWYLKKCVVFIGPPCTRNPFPVEAVQKLFKSATVTKNELVARKGKKNVFFLGCSVFLSIHPHQQSR